MDCADEWAVGIGISGFGQGQESGFEVGGHRFAGHQSLPAGRQRDRDAAFTGLHGFPVHPQRIEADRLDAGHPGLPFELGAHHAGIAGDPDQPARAQMRVDQRLRRALVEQPSVAQDAHLVGHPLHVVQDVTGEDHRPAAPHARHQRQQFGTAGGVERGGGLVQDEQFRVADQRAGEPEPLGHAPGESAHLAVRDIAQAGRRQCVGDRIRCCADVLARCSDQRAGQVDHLVGGQPGVELRDVGADRDAAARHGQSDLAAIGAPHPGDDRQHRRLAGAVRTDEPVDGPAGHGQVDVEQSRPAVITGEARGLHDRAFVGRRDAVGISAFARVRWRFATAGLFGVVGYRR